MFIIQWHINLDFNCNIMTFVYDPYSDQSEARRSKVKEARKRREERQAQKRAELLKTYAKEDEAAKK